MCADIIKFVVAVQIWFERFGDCNVIDFKEFWNVTKIIIINIITIIVINIQAPTVIQLQCVPLNDKLKYTYLSL